MNENHFFQSMKIHIKNRTKQYCFQTAFSLIPDFHFTANGFHVQGDGFTSIVTYHIRPGIGKGNQLSIQYLICIRKFTTNNHCQIQPDFLRLSAYNGKNANHLSDVNTPLFQAGICWNRMDMQV
ncbi:MAG: hypothetical protein C4522_18185 [Desulfobacteraceae bacterium]|nr:MAG: hypothetical protein C4522_18185 [Desulfobacteraceae bacterium]